MPKKKGSATKKKAAKPLTEEEKLMLAKQQAQQEQERQAMAAQFLREKLAQEQRNTNISLKKLNQQWRQILRQVKSEELKKEIEILSQTFERTLDRKDAVLKALAMDLDESDMQMDRAAQAHAQKVDQIAAFNQHLVEDLKAEFSNELSEIQKEFMREREAIVEQHEKEIAEIKDIQFAMNMANEAFEEKQTNAFTNKRDEVRARYMEERAELKSRLEVKIKELWDLFQQAQKNYEHNTADKMAEFERLRAKDQQFAATLALQGRKIARLQEKIQGCKQRMSTAQKECEQRNNEVKQQKEETLGTLQHLKSQMARSRARARDKLTALAAQAKETAAELKNKLDQGEKIMLQAEICRKLETEQEKVLPFYAESLTREEIAAEASAEDGMPAAAAAPQPLPEEPFAPHAMAFSQEGHPVSEYAALDNFWKRHNKVLLDKLALERQRAQLTEENEKLRAMLQQYLEGISVSEEILAKDNSLLIVNGRTNAKVNVPVGDGRVQTTGRPTVVEARDVVHTRRLADR